MNPLRKCTVTKGAAWLALLALGMGASFAYAAPVGTITHLSGPLVDKKADGSVKVLSVQSTVEQGDTLVTQKNTYAQIKFTDDSTITLKPDTQFKIDSFSFEPEKKENDSAIFSLIKGGLREVTGLLGKRSKERFGLHTPTATIGIRGTIFIAQLQEAADGEAGTQASDGNSTGGNAAAGGSASSIAEGLNPSVAGGAINGGGSTTTQPIGDPRFGPPKGVNAPPKTQPPPVPALIMPPPGAPVAPMPPTPASPGIQPGLYVQVLEGMINVSNNGGAQNFAAGQFGFVPSLVMPPIILPQNPGLKFSPPPSFSSSTVGQGSNGAPGKEGDVDCEVR